MKLAYGILGVFVEIVALWMWQVRPEVVKQDVTDPGGPNVMYNQAKTVADLRFSQAQNNGKWDVAIAAYTDAISIRPENSEAQNDLGASYYQKALGLLGDPIEQDLRAYSSDPKDSIDYIHERLGEGGKYTWEVNDDVMLLLEDYIAEHQNFLYARTPVGMYHQVTFISGAAVPALKLAEIHLRRSMDIKPDYAPAYRNLGAMYITQGRLRGGTDILDQALQLEPGDSELYQYIQQLKGY